MPLIDRLLIKNNQPGRPRKQVKVLAADIGYDSKDLRAALRKALLGKLSPEDFTKTWYQTTVAETPSEDKEKSGQTN